MGCRDVDGIAPDDDLSHPTTTKLVVKDINQTSSNEMLHICPSKKHKVKVLENI